MSAIGVFDSGVGGLSVLKEIHQRLPGESLLYLADSAYAPYGDKTHDVIVQRSEKCVEWLLAQDAKAIVVACNTATAAAVKWLRAEYALPIIAMEPALKPAARMSRSGVVGVMATAGTLKSEKFAALQQMHASDVRVITQPCLGLVDEIEKGDFASPALKQLVERYTSALIDQNVDVIVLGCTHYPLIRSLIESLVPAHVKVIDSGAAVAQRVEAQLREHGLLAKPENQARIQCWSSGDKRVLQHVVSDVLNINATVDSIESML